MINSCMFQISVFGRYGCIFYLRSKEREGFMNYSIHMNTVSNIEKNVKAYASVTFEDCFQVRNIAVVQSRDGVLFVSMSAFKSKERTENNEVVYKDVCNPITGEFRSRLYEDIIGMYEELNIKKRNWRVM